MLSHFPLSKPGQHRSLSIHRKSFLFQDPPLDPLHLTALRYHDIRGGFLPPRPGVFDFPNHIHALDDFPEDDVLVVQKRGRDGCDEELAAVGVGAGVLGREEVTLGGYTWDWQEGEREMEAGEKRRWNAQPY